MLKIRRGINLNSSHYGVPANHLFRINYERHAKMLYYPYPSTILLLLGFCGLAEKRQILPWLHMISSSYFMFLFLFEAELLCWTGAEYIWHNVSLWEWIAFQTHFGVYFILICWFYLSSILIYLILLFS